MQGFLENDYGSLLVHSVGVGWWGNGCRPQTIVFMFYDFVVLEILDISLGEEGKSLSQS